MVSDLNSVSSASPRTVASPQLLPLPVDTRAQFGDPHRPQTADDLYFPRLFTEPSSKPRWVPDHHRPYWLVSQEETRIESFKIDGRRDSRMGLENLLN